MTRYGVVGGVVKMCRLRTQELAPCRRRAALCADA